MATAQSSLHHTSREPEVCHVCGRRSGGLATGPKGDRWLCVECYPLLEYVKDVRRWDGYELSAIQDVDTATGEFAAVHGTDIAAMDTETRQALWRLVCRSWGDGIRRALKTAPF
jgi:hypothetical protein